MSIGDDESYHDWHKRMTPTAEDREYGHRMSTKETSWIPVGRHIWKLVGAVRRNAVTNRYITEEPND